MNLETTLYAIWLMDTLKKKKTNLKFIYYIFHCQSKVSFSNVADSQT